MKDKLQLAKIANNQIKEHFVLANLTGQGFIIYINILESAINAGYEKGIKDAAK